VHSQKIYILTKLILATFILTFLNSCGQMAHDTLKNISKKQNCDDIPNFDEKRECENRYNKMDYHQYRRVYEEK